MFERKTRLQDKAGILEVIHRDAMLADQVSEPEVWDRRNERSLRTFTLPNRIGVGVARPGHICTGLRCITRKRVARLRYDLIAVARSGES